MTEATSSAGDLVTVCAAGHGRATWALGSLFETLVTAGQTGGSLDAAVVTQPPGLATPLHVHTREAEAWFVLDGTLIYRAGDELVEHLLLVHDLHPLSLEDRVNDALGEVTPYLESHGGITHSTAEGSSLATNSAAVAIAGAVLRPVGSRTIRASSIPAARSCSATTKRCS